MVPWGKLDILLMNIGIVAVSGSFRVIQESGRSDRPLEGLQVSMCDSIEHYLSENFTRQCTAHLGLLGINQSKLNLKSSLGFTNSCVNNQGNGSLLYRVPCITVLQINTEKKKDVEFGRIKSRCATRFIGDT